MSSRKDSNQACAEFLYASGRLEPIAISGSRRHIGGRPCGHIDTTGGDRARNISAGKFYAELYFAIVSGNLGDVGDVGGV